MADKAHDSETSKIDVKEEAYDSVSKEKDGKELSSQDIESQINGAMRSRVSYFKKQADSLTFEGVRRVLEEDLDLEKYALDVHKRFIKERLLQCLENAGNDNASLNSGSSGEKHASPTTEMEESPQGLMLKKDVKEPNTEDEGRMEDSPVLGLLTAHKATNSETKETQSKKAKEVSESTIKKAIRKRASYLKLNSEEVTMVGLRRLLEEDLKLDKYALDPYKKFISEQLDQVLASHEASEPVIAVKKKNLKRNVPSKASKKLSSKGSSDSSDSVSDEEENEVKSKKKVVSKRETQKTEGFKKRNRPEKKTTVSGKKRMKVAETNSDNNSDVEDSEIVSEDGHSQSSAEKPVKKKEASAAAYGKHVEHLKSVIKSCGMSVPPSVYRKVKQVPESKREANLIKELEEILSREGLSPNPSEKEIKDVRRRKERAKELEGIDMSNIVSSSRRRSTTTFVAPPKPKIPDENSGDDSEDTENEREDEDDDVEEEEEEESQSGEFNEEDDEDSD